jgi:hypothetical protein
MQRLRRNESCSHDSLAYASSYLLILNSIRGMSILLVRSWYVHGFAARRDRGMAILAVVSQVTI